MTRLIREKRPPRTNTHLNARLSPEQNAASDEQSKRDRRRAVEGLIRRAQPNPKPIDRWRAIRAAKQTEKKQTEGAAS